MPYIKNSHRYDVTVRGLPPRSPGELNFLFYTSIKRYLDHSGESYQSYNDVIGALECCKQEVYRRMISPYEDIKIKENGDV